MILKLAIRNIVSKPFRALATVIAIAVAVAMIFAMLSFRSAVFDFIYASDTAISGDSDIVISTNSSSSRITNVAQPLLDSEGVSYVVPSLSLYATFNDEYVQVRGFQYDGGAQTIDKLQKIDLSYGSLQGMQPDDVVISSAAAKRFGLSIGDRITLSLGALSAKFCIKGISKPSGYFLEDSPYLFVGYIDQVSTLISPVSLKDVCNEIYIGVESGYSAQDVIDRVSALEQYKDFLIGIAGDKAAVDEQTKSLTAPVTLAGGAVLLLSVAVLILLFMMGEQDKTSLIAKLGIIGATKRQMVGLFLVEGLMLSLVGTAVGSGLAVGLFAIIIKATLSSAAKLSVSAGMLLSSVAIGFIVSTASSLIPVFRSFRRTVRENQLDVKKPSLAYKIACVAVFVFAVASVILEFCLDGATKYLSIVSMLTSLASLWLLAPIALKGAAAVSGKLHEPSLSVSAYSLTRDRRHSRSVAALSVGMTIGMLLFMAYSLTTSIFNAYTSDFANVIFMSNIKADIDVSEIEEVDGVRSASLAVWKQVGLSGDNFSRSMNLIGSSGALDLADFGYLTSKEVVEQRISTDEPLVFIDNALYRLYGVQEGDALALEVDGVKKQVKVGGILKHRLFNGQYVIMSLPALNKLYGITGDTVLISTSGDVNDASNLLRQKYADKNYYVVDALEAYKWDMSSTQAVFDLVGTLAAVVTAFIFAAVAAAALVGRSSGGKARTALLNAGMSKTSLLKSEIAEYGFIAAVSLALSVIFSVLLTACLIHALRLFGLYFEFMYSAWVVFVVGLALGAGYTLIPLIFNFKKGYTLSKSRGV